jgi:tetratricopeptide (TPR) repeat protein
MKTKILLFTLISFLGIINVQAQTVAELQATAQAFMKQGDYSNAIMILNRCVEKEPENRSVGKDLALSYFYSSNPVKALETIQPVLKSDEADDQTFIIAGSIYKSLDKAKDAEKTFKKGIARFPESGNLYNELGELQVNNGSREAIKTWEKGIKADPAFGRNYFNASRYYFFEKNFIWSLIYGEIFLNTEPLGNRAAETKGTLLESYKQIFATDMLGKDFEKRNDFEKKFLTALKKQQDVLNKGITVESLTMMRTRFILDWYAPNEEKPELKLFEHQQLLLRSGLFDSYNQWIFGVTENVTAYQNWIKNNNADYVAFVKFQQSRTFKMPLGQYYH